DLKDAADIAAVHVTRDALVDVEEVLPALRTLVPKVDGAPGLGRQAAYPVVRSDVGRERATVGRVRAFVQRGLLARGNNAKRGPEERRHRNHGGEDGEGSFR